jgi:hypothetical protein
VERGSRYCNACGAPLRSQAVATGDGRTANLLKNYCRDIVQLPVFMGIFAQKPQKISTFVQFVTQELHAPWKFV